MITLDAFGNPVVGNPDTGTCVSVETVAAMRTFKTEPNAGDTVITRGETYEGDGLGGFWYWVPNSLLPDDGVTVVKCTDILAGRFYRDPLEGTGIADGAVTTPKLADAAVTLIKMAFNSVGFNQLVNLCVDTGKISDVAVTAAKIATGAVTTGKLASGAVDDTKLAALSVATGHVQAGAITLAKLADLAANTVIGSAAGGVPTALTMTAAGRAVNAAVDYAAIRTLLSIPDITDEATASLVHANTVCNFTYPSVEHVFYNHAKIGTLGSEWTLLTTGSGALGNSGKGVAVSSWKGGSGANILTTGATASSVAQLISVVNGLSLYGGAFIDNLVAADSKWHVETVFKISTTPDAQTEIGVGWADTGGTSLVMGVRGAQSTTKFRVFKVGTSTGTNSTVNVDTNPHRFRMWGNGDGKIYFSVDYETPVQLTGLTWADTAAAPFVQVSNGSTAAAQTVYLGATRYRVNGAVA